ncbi:MAG TPA: hypothetical protein VMN77_09950 [Nitrospiria bacterium]|jgi:hypothetical protein|nr:hypothetical protein [Nitrospiria bacterium]
MNRCEELIRQGVIVLLALVSFFESGCTYSQKYNASIPNLEGTGLAFARNSSLQQQLNLIDLPEFLLSIKPLNARLVSKINSWFLFIPVPFNRVYPEAERFGQNDQSASSPFLIEIALSRSIGEVLVDPSQLTLHLAGQDYTPKRMIMPSDLRSIRASRLGITRCVRKNNFPLQEMARPIHTIQIVQGEMACIWLSFDAAPPPPETEFSLTVNGIKVAGRTVQIPTIQFIKGVAYVYDSVP